MRKPTVLIIDDEPDVRRYHATVLSDHGWRVSTASGADEGLRMARQDPPDVVLLDLMMPERGGLSALVELRKDARLRSARIVIITGIDQEVTNIYGKNEHYDASLRRFKKFKADAYLEKPVKPDELLATLEGLLVLAGAE
jgi:DNA-binding response OmpR family regulator